MYNLNWITDQIATSDSFETKELKDIKNMGFDAIVDLRSEDEDDEKK